MGSKFLAGLFVALLAGAAAGYYVGYDQGFERAARGSDAKERVGIANPASENCAELGGRLEIVDGEEGQFGLCHLPDGRVCEEWSLFRGGCDMPE